MHSLSTKYVFSMHHWARNTAILFEPITFIITMPLHETDVMQCSHAVIEANVQA